MFLSNVTFNAGFIDGRKISEIYFRGEKIWPNTKLSPLPKPKIICFTENDSKIHIKFDTNTRGKYDLFNKITGSGIIWMNWDKLKNRILTINTSGRSKIGLSVKEDGVSGTFILMTYDKKTLYVCRAFISFLNAYGKTQYIYSDMEVFSLDTLTKEDGL